MLIAEIKIDDCEGWREHFQFGPNVTIHQALRIPINTPPGAILRIKRVESDYDGPMDYDKYRD